MCLLPGLAVVYTSPTLSYLAPDSPCPPSAAVPAVPHPTPHPSGAHSQGIPFKATAADVRKFFGGYRIKADGISFIMHADGRPTGMAFIEFETPQEAVSQRGVGGGGC